MCTGKNPVLTSYIQRRKWISTNENEIWNSKYKFTDSNNWNFAGVLLFLCLPFLFALPVGSIAFPSSTVPTDDIPCNLSVERNGTFTLTMETAYSFETLVSN